MKYVQTSKNTNFIENYMRKIYLYWLPKEFHCRISFGCHNFIKDLRNILYMHIYFRVHVYQVSAVMFRFLWFVKVRPSHKQLWFVQDRFPPSAPEMIVRGTREPPLKAPPQNALAVVLSGWHWMLEVICSPQQGQNVKIITRENLLTVVYFPFFLLLNLILCENFWGWCMCI